LKTCWMRHYSQWRRESRINEFLHCKQLKITQDCFNSWVQGWYKIIICNR
jgi:hypothetical protein